MAILTARVGSPAKIYFLVGDKHYTLIFCSKSEVECPHESIEDHTDIPYTAVAAE